MLSISLSVPDFDIEPCLPCNFAQFNMDFSEVAFKWLLVTFPGDNGVVYLCLLTGAGSKVTSARAKPRTLRTFVLLCVCGAGPGRVWRKGTTLPPVVHTVCHTRIRQLFFLHIRLLLTEELSSECFPK